METNDEFERKLTAQRQELLAMNPAGIKLAYTEQFGQSPNLADGATWEDVVDEIIEDRRRRGLI